MTEQTQTIEAMWGEIFAKRPELKKLLEKFGSSTLASYIDEHLAYPWRAKNEGRAKELIAVLHEITAQRLSETIADSLGSQLQENFSISTVDHHGPVGHPFFLNSNLLLSAWSVKKELSCVPVLSNANVSLNNSSFPRGFQIHEREGGVASLPIITADSNMRPVYFEAGYNTQSLQRVLESVSTVSLPVSKKDRLAKSITEIFADAQTVPSYTEQITKINFKTWNLLSQLWEKQLPLLLYIEQETVVNELLLRHHVHQDTILSSLLFNPKYHQLLEQYCSGIQGAFDQSSLSGTFLFWGKLPSGHRTALWRNGDLLVSEDGSQKYALTPEGVQRGLSERTLVPSMLLCFMVISFYYGAECFGGFSQIDYLAKMKAAYQAILQSDHALEDEQEMLESLSTNKLTEGIGLAFLENETTFVLATTLDLLVHGEKSGGSNLTKTIEKITLREAMTPYLPELYKIIVGKDVAGSVGIGKSEVVFPAAALG